MNCGGISESDGDGTDYFYYGGAIYSSGPGICAVSDCQFTDNQGSRGGGIYAENGLVEDCVFDGNTAFGSFQVSGRGGAVWLGAGSIRRCTFTGNIAAGEWGTSQSLTSGLGGAVYAASGVIEDCQFEGNQVNNNASHHASQISLPARLRGGAVFAEGPVTLRKSTFNASAVVPRPFTSSSLSIFQEIQGCGVYLANGGTVEGCSFTGNGTEIGSYLPDTRWFGGGLYVEAGVASVTSSTFEDNEAERGGAIYNEGGSLEVSLSVLRSNRTVDLLESTQTAERPAISGNAILERCTIVGHAAAPTGCLLYTSPSPRDQRGSRMPSSA